MSSRTAPLAGTAVVAALAVLAWWTTRNSTGAVDPEVTATPTTTFPVEKPIVPPAAATIEPAPEVFLDVVDSGEPVAVDYAAVKAAVAPFETIGIEALATDDVVEASAETETVSESVTLDAEMPVGVTDGGTASDRDRVIVPSSYPISDALKYYVSPDERGPGSLGRPPPVDFSGGPNDRNRSGGGFVPPAAPGQEASADRNRQPRPTSSRSNKR